MSNRILIFSDNDAIFIYNDQAGKVKLCNSDIEC